MKTSDVVNLCDWKFSFGGSDARFGGTELFHSPDVVQLATPLALLLHLAEDGANDTGFRNQIEERLKADPVAKIWHKKRGKIGSQPHFARYRQNGGYDRYHEAAAAVAAGTASEKQRDLVLGLDQEIAASEVSIPNGQVLFHGRADRALDESPSYASFISTSLVPTVCIFHGLKRAFQKGPPAKPVIYLLTVRGPLRAIWGNGGGLNEWELLLPPQLQCTVVSTHEGTRFELVNATIGARDSSEIEPAIESL